MKQKGWSYAIPSLFLLLATGLGGVICGVLFLNVQLTQIVWQHQQVYQRYLALEHQMLQSSITVYEGSRLVGVYSLEDVGLRSQAEAAIQALYSPVDRLTPEEFSKLSYGDMLDWAKEAHPEGTTITLDPRGFQPEHIWYDLDQIHREPSVDAQLVFTGSQYLVEPEVYGTQLDINGVMDALMELPEAIVFSDDTHAQLSIDVSPYYIRPQVTLADQTIDYEAQMRQDLAYLNITIHFDGSSYTVDPVALLAVDDTGMIVLREDAVEDLVDDLVQSYTQYGQPYYFNSYLQGRIPLSCLAVDYVVQRQPLKAALTDALESLESASITARYSTQRNGRDFSLGSTYIAIDITNQNMVYYKDGALVLSTDVVTGAPAHGGTPRGLYTIRELDRDCWLSGVDYRVHAEYWIGFYGNYGIHDAPWRETFGGSLYLNSGSHGCVNTPESAMIALYEAADLGTPVLIY